MRFARSRLALCALFAAASLLAGPVGAAPTGGATPSVEGPPTFKPSSSSPAPMDITTNDYGAFGPAPHAPSIGDIIPDFELPRARGGMFKLADEAAKGPLLIMFYRGHW